MPSDQKPLYPFQFTNIAKKIRKKNLKKLKIHQKKPKPKNIHIKYPFNWKF